MPTLDKTGGIPRITEEGYAVLADIVTDPTGEVYLIKDLPPQTIGAMMARLSRSANGCRILYLDEFHEQEGKDADLVDRVVTGFGDDSVQQLITVYLVAENISNLMTKLLERPRPGAYLEQSTRYIFFDQKDAVGNYRYYTPPGLEGFTADYKKGMDQIFGLYSDTVRQLVEHLADARSGDRPEGMSDGAWRTVLRGQACDAARPMLPTATTSTVGAVLSTQSVDSLVMYLRSLGLPEASGLAERILLQSRQVVGDFLKRTDRPDRGLAISAYLASTRAKVQRFVDQNLEERSGLEGLSVELVDSDADVDRLLAQILFASSDRGLVDLERWVEVQPEEVKRELLQAAVGERLNRRHKPGRAFERPRYWFEFVGRYGDFRDIQRHRMVDGMEWQRLTPYMGYDVPQLILEAGLEKNYNEAFDISGKLFEQLRDGFGREVAQYATLFGHRMRYTFGANLRELYHLIELRSGPDGHPGYRKIAQEMYARIQEATPLLAEGMSFVNQRDMNDELTRLASVRAQEFKQRQALILPGS